MLFSIMLLQKTCTFSPAASPHLELVSPQASCFDSGALFPQKPTGYWAERCSKHNVCFTWTAWPRPRRDGTTSGNCRGPSAASILLGNSWKRHEKWCRSGRAKDRCQYVTKGEVLHRIVGDMTHSSRSLYIKVKHLVQKTRVNCDKANLQQIFTPKTHGVKLDRRPKKAKSRGPKGARIFFYIIAKVFFACIFICCHDSGDSSHIFCCVCEFLGAAFLSSTCEWG